MVVTQDYSGLVSRLKFLTLPTATPDTAADYLVFLDATTGDLARALWPSGISDGDKGDITVSSSGTVWTLDAGTVTLAKMANMATASILGRNTAGTGSPEVLSASTARSVLGLGTSATRDVGSAAGTVAAGDDSRLSDRRSAAAIYTTAGGGVDLPTGSIADGEFLKRVGSDIVGATPPSGGGTTGTTEINFGLFPGSSDASVTVTGQTGILSGSVVQAWLFPKATTDHSVDEHRVETISVTAGDVVAGSGFTIYGQNTSQLNEQVTAYENAGFATTKAATTVFGNGIGSQGGQGTRIYGVWSVAWRWS